MKIFMGKLKKASWPMKLCYFLTLILYWICYILFTKSLLNLIGIETVIRYIVIICAGIYGLLFTVFGLTKMFLKKKVGFTILVIISLIFSIVFGVGSYYIDKLYNKIENFSSKETSTYTTVLLSLKETSFTKESKIGMITDEEDRTGYILPTEWIKKDNIPNEIEYYENTLELLEALYNKEVDAIFITKDYPIIYGNENKYQNIVNETKIESEYQKEMKTEESELLTTTKSLTEPFTVLVLGVDSEASDGLDANAAFNGDTLMLLTFNPKTLTATMLSIPRDMYVPIISASGQSKWYGKINSSAGLGTASTINTIENITNIDIDYFVKVNFRGVIDLVNTLGGIDVDVEQPDYDYYIASYGKGRLCESDANRDMTNLVCMDTGLQHLNGEQALAYARNRHGFLESDIARNRHQQQIIEAIAKKLVHTSSFSEFEKLLDTISNNIATNMKTSQILSFYQSLKGMLMNALSGEEFITIQKMQLTYYSIQVDGLDCLGYYEGSMDAIEKAMKENLGLLEVQTIKTFSYDYSEDYEQDSNIIGKGIYTGTRLQTMPSFIGSSVSKAETFAKTNGLKMNIEYKDDPNEIAGIILDQSVASGTLTNQFSSFTIYVNNPTTPKKDDDEDKDENKENNKNDDNKNNDEDKKNEEDDQKENNEDKKPNDNENDDKENENTPTIPGNPDIPVDNPKKDEDNNTKPEDTPSSNTSPTDKE